MLKVIVMVSQIVGVVSMIGWMLAPPDLEADFEMIVVFSLLTALLSYDLMTSARIDALTARCEKLEKTLATMIKK